MGATPEQPEPIFVYTLKKPSMAAVDQAKLVAKEDRVTAAKRKEVSKQITYFRTTMTKPEHSV